MDFVEGEEGGGGPVVAFYVGGVGLEGVEAIEGCGAVVLCIICQ